MQLPSHRKTTVEQALKECPVSGQIGRVTRVTKKLQRNLTNAQSGSLTTQGSTLILPAQGYFWGAFSSTPACSLPREFLEEQSYQIFFFLIPSASLGLYNVQESCKPLVNSHGSMFIPRTRVDTTNTPAYNLLNIGGEAMAKEEGMKQKSKLFILHLDRI